MYVPSSDRQHDLGELHAAIVSARLGTFVTVADGVPLVSHVPMLLDASAGPLGTLRFHLARANPQARALAGGAAGLAIFLGPSAYVSPGWYESKRLHGKVVPTSHYIAVHASGPVAIVDDECALHTLVDDLTRYHERTQPEAWTVDDAPKPYVKALLRAIRGVTLPIARLEGKWKLGTGDSEADVAGVARGLEASGDARDAAIAREMRRARERPR